MRWNCPHCGVNLAVSDEKLGTGWSFSRCYKCGGFALIRRAEVNLVKVDRAPAGEHIILPEATEEPSSMLSQEASENLNRLKAMSAERAATRAAAQAALAAQEEAARQAALAQAQAQALAQSQTQGHAPMGTAGDLTIPPPLPEIPGRASKASARNRILQGAITAAATMTIGSGIYLYIQGQALWEKARTTAQSEQRESTIRPAAVRASEVVAAPNITDQVHHGAMAPMRAEAPEAPAVTPPPAAAIAQPVAQPAAQAPAETGEKPAAPAVKQSILVVQPKSRSADLHSGPGSLYPVLGMANPAGSYVVTDWNDRWFKVLLPKQGILNSTKLAQKTAPRTAWIRTDLVQVVPAARAPELQPIH